MWGCAGATLRVNVTPAGLENRCAFWGHEESKSGWLVHLPSIWRLTSWTFDVIVFGITAVHGRVAHFTEGNATKSVAIPRLLLAGEVIVNSFAVQANKQLLPGGLPSFVVAEIPQNYFLRLYIDLAKRTNFCLAELTRKADPLDQLPQSQPKYHQSGEPYSNQCLQWHRLILGNWEEKPASPSV